MSVSFQTNTLKSRRKAIIDGHEFIVRQYGNIERLEVLRIQNEVKELSSKYPENVSDAEISQEDMKTLLEKSSQAANILVSLFDDGTETQELSRRLVSSLGENDIAEIITEVFKQTETVEKTEPVNEAKKS